MYQVEMQIGAKPKHAWASVRFKDRTGKVHRRDLEVEGEETVNRNYLKVLAEAFRILTRPCMVTVYIDSDYIAACFQNGWVYNWEKNDWKNSKGKPVRNEEQWKAVRKSMAPHSIRFVYVKDEKVKGEVT